jgi:hypothetical protein
MIFSEWARKMTKPPSGGLSFGHCFANLRNSGAGEGARSAHWATLLLTCYGQFQQTVCRHISSQQNEARVFT